MENMENYIWPELGEDKNIYEEIDINKTNFAETEKEKRISAELKRLNQFFEKADANQRALVAPLLQNAAFMKVTLEDLQEQINEEGVTEVYQNGANQKGVKQSATLQSYNALIKNYTSVIKALSHLLPPAERQALPSLTTWKPREKTKEEIEEDLRKAREREERVRMEIERAVEYQRRQREAEAAKK